MKKEAIRIYTDGACSKTTGAWAAIILIGDELQSLSGIAEETTHNRMEIMAALKAIEWLAKKDIQTNKISIYSDSQYLVGLPARKKKLTINDFLTKNGSPIRNVDLVKKLYEVMDKNTIELIKVKAHQKKTPEVNYNREVDKMVRKLLRQHRYNIQ